MNELRKIEEDTYKLFSTEDKSALVLLPTDYIYHPVELSIEDISYVLEKAIFPYDAAALAHVQLLNDELLINGVKVFAADISRSEVIADILESLAVLKYLDDSVNNVLPKDISKNSDLEEELVFESFDDEDDYNIPLNDDSDIEYYIPIVDSLGNESEWSFSQDRWDKLVRETSLEQAAEIIAHELDDIDILLRTTSAENVKVIKNFILTCAPKEDFVSDVVDFVNNHA